MIISGDSLLISIFFALSAMLFDWADEWLNVYWTVNCRVATACHRSLFHFDQVFFYSLGFLMSYIIFS
jgi:hypothetical protein